MDSGSAMPEFDRPFSETIRLSADLLDYLRVNSDNFSGPKLAPGSDRMGRPRGRPPGSALVRWLPGGWFDRRELHSKYAKDVCFSTLSRLPTRTDFRGEPFEDPLRITAHCMRWIRARLGAVWVPGATVTQDGR